MSISKNSERKRLLNAVNEYGFALSDITLFLDTHPQNQDALEYYRHVNKMYKMAKSEYENQFGPLNIFSGQDDNIWKWAVQSWPWERGYC